jgi:hypothetical protein
MPQTLCIKAFPAIHVRCQQKSGIDGATRAERFVGELDFVRSNNII